MWPGYLAPRAILWQPPQLRPMAFILAFIASSPLPAIDAIPAAAALSALPGGAISEYFVQTSGLARVRLPRATLPEPFGHTAPFFMFVTAASFSTAAWVFAALSGIFPFAIEPRIPSLNDYSCMTALLALIYLAECSAAAAGPVGDEIPSASATPTAANVMYLIMTSPFFLSGSSLVACLSPQAEALKISTPIPNELLFSVRNENMWSNFNDSFPVGRKHHGP